MTIRHSGTDVQVVRERLRAVLVRVHRGVAGHVAVPPVAGGPWVVVVDERGLVVLALVAEESTEPIGVSAIQIARYCVAYLAIAQARRGVVDMTTYTVTAT